ncbi:MAG: Hsp33 family molecular chaperone HslO, partial [Gammaproteobacteria bacterium]|nr:Hsp33 family molecular chaperone HslO [Gammaproteobacteria bacterium]
MNTIRRFLFKGLNIRGQHLSIDQTWQSLIKGRGYTTQVKQTFGELSALAIMLANGIKHKGKLTMQYQGNGIVSLLLVEVTHDMKVRGMVRSDGVIEKDDSLDDILGEGQMVATLYNAQTDHSFQSLIPRNPKGLIQTFEDYFTQSEQLDSKLWVSSSKDNLSAMLIQKMPETKNNDEEDWNRVTALASTTTSKELCDLDAEQ